jgi:hypothetical protein
MSQLVGSTCVLCGKTIPSICDGGFCPSCGCPVHARCATGDPGRSDGCRTCGAPIQIVREREQQQLAEAAQHERDIVRMIAYRKILYGFLFLFGGTIFSLITLALSAASGFTFFIIATGVIGGGIIQILAGFALLRPKEPGSRPQASPTRPQRPSGSNTQPPCR